MIGGGGDVPQEQHVEQGVETEIGFNHHIWHEIKESPIASSAVGGFFLLLGSVAAIWLKHKLSNKDKTNV